MLKGGESPMTAATSSKSPSILIALNPSIIFFIMRVGWLDTLNNLEVPRWLQKAEILV
jgi:hypothetical protein